MNLGETIETLREQMGISTAVLAGKCKVSPTHMYDIEKGRRNPSERLLLLIAAHLETDVSPLLEMVRRKRELIRRIRKNPEEFESLMVGEEK